MAIDTRSARAHLDRLVGALDPPSRIGPFALTGMLANTDTALVYTARGDVFGSEEGVLKLTSAGYAPVLLRELDLLLTCAEAQVEAVIRPHHAEAIPLVARGVDAVAIALPFYRGGQIGRGARPFASRHALEVGNQVAETLRSLLELPRPIIHGDVRCENVLLPRRDASPAELVLIDFDVSRQLDASIETIDDPESAAVLHEDVRGFGRLLYELATGREVTEVRSHPRTRNSALNRVVVRCLGGAPYASLADADLWRDLELAFEIEDALALDWRGRLRRLFQRQPEHA